MFYSTTSNQENEQLSATQQQAFGQGTTNFVNDVTMFVNGLMPAWQSFWGNVKGLFGNNQMSEIEREMAIQQQLYAMQQQQQQKQQQTIIIAAVVCVLAIIVTVLITRKS